MSELNDPATHVIFGTGPVGCWIARALRAMDIPVRAVNRSGHCPDLLPADVEQVTADVSDPDQAMLLLPVLRAVRFHPVMLCTSLQKRLSMLR